jgi:spore germination protein GerM
MKRSTFVIVGLLIFAVLAWAGTRWLALRRPPDDVATIEPDSLGTGFKAARLFFASADGDGLVSESRELPESASLRERAASLVAELDRGPAGGGVAALPPGTSLLHVYLDDEGLLTVDLSRAFQQGFRGGSSAEYLAVSSLVRTLGANLPDVRRVLIVCGGSPIPTLGGHLPLDRPFDVPELP